MYKNEKKSPSLENGLCFEKIEFVYLVLGIRMSTVVLLMMLQIMLFDSHNWGTEKCRRGSGGGQSSRLS